MEVLQAVPLYVPPENRFLVPRAGAKALKRPNSLHQVRFAVVPVMEKDM